MVLDLLRGSRRLALVDLDAPAPPLASRQQRVKPLILIVDSDRRLLERNTKALGAAGYTVAAFTDVMRAWDALRTPGAADLLVTRLAFGAGLPNGVALARHAVSRDRLLPVLYTPVTLEIADRVDPTEGAMLLRPFTTRQLVAKVRDLFATANLSL